MPNVGRYTIGVEMKKLIFFLAITYCPYVIAADGNLIYQNCRSNNKVISTFCQGYIQGLLAAYPWGFGNGMSASRELLEVVGTNDSEILAKYNQIALPIALRIGAGFCTSSSKGLTVEQKTDIVINYLRNNPQVRNRPAYELVMTAMEEAFPLDNCKD